MNRTAIVTKGNATFHAGDHIMFYENGDVGCREAGGWIPSDEIPYAMKGVEWRDTTDEQITQRIKQLRAELAELENA